MQRTLPEDAFDLVINFVILSINLIMLFIMLTRNISISSISVWELAINRGLFFGNVSLAFLSFYWVSRKRIRLENIIEEIKKTK